MNTHSIELDGYYARSRGNSTIYLGTAGSHGNEQLQVTQGKGWEGLTVQVVFHPCKVAVQLPANGVLDVPWEATARPLTAMQGRIVFQGFDQDRLVNSTDLAYSVASHSPALGRDEQPYTPGIVEGVLNQMAADKDAILQAAQQTGQAKEAAAASAAEAASSAANAQQSAGAANTSASQAAASASQAAGSAAAANETLTQVQTAGQEAQQKVKDAETEALDKIAAAAPALPAVSTDAAWQSVTVKPDGSGYNLAVMAPIEATIRPTANGNPAVCEDSVAWGLQGLKIYGKSTQDGTPSPENPVPIASAGEGGSVELTVTGKNLIDKSKITLTKNNVQYGTRTGDIWCYLKSNTSYTMSVPDDVSVPDSIQFIEKETNDHVSTAYLKRSVSFLPDHDLAVRLDAYWTNGRPENAIVLQLEIGSVATAYEPYTGQSLPLSTPSGLTGIPVKSGGNYVDSAGQQRICDVVDFLKKEYISQCFVLKITSDTDFIKSSAGGVPRFSVSSCPAAKASALGLCNVLPVNTVPLGTENAVGISGYSGGGVYFRNPDWNSVEDVKNYVKNTEIVFIYPLATPIITPLSDEEVAAYRALQTYAGTTVVSTAEPVAGIEASYVMDGNKYRESVDKRLAALEAAQTGI